MLGPQDSNGGSSGVRRRDLPALVLGAAAVVDWFYETKGFIEASRPVRTAKVDGPFAFGKARFSVLEVEHNEKSWTENQAAIGGALVGATFLFPEYVNAAYRDLERNPFLSQYVQQYRDDNALFDFTALYALHHDMDIIATDPAYDEQYLKLMTAFGAPEFLLQTGATTAVTMTVADRLLKDDNPPLLSRLGLLKLLPTVGVGRIAGQFAGHNLLPAQQHGLLEFRHLVAAESMSRYMRLQSADPKAHGLAIFPHGHWDPKGKGIKYWMSNPRERTDRLASYKQVVSDVLHFPDLFDVRRFAHGDTSADPIILRSRDLPLAPEPLRLVESRSKRLILQ